MARVFLTHSPEMLRNYYGERAIASLSEFADVIINPTGRVLDAEALTQHAQGCEIVISDRQTPGFAAFSSARRTSSPSCVAPSTFETLPWRPLAAKASWSRAPRPALPRPWLNSVWAS